jgi:glycosyltransferase involved in cell wall biosynthesis
MSLVLCCHNSARRLPETLGHLAAQQVPAGAEWEVVLVDNASTDGTAEAARRIWGDGPAPLRVVEEPRAGLSWARLAGARAARYDALTLVDDDNWLAPDWLVRSLDVLRDHPNVGAVGGCSVAVCEVPTPGVVSRRRLELRRRPAGRRERRRDGDTRVPVGRRPRRCAVPPGATCSLPVSGSSSTIGPAAACARAATPRSATGSTCEAGGCVYESDLRFRHFLPAGRLRWRYSRRLYRSFGEASVVLDTYLLALRERDSRDVAEAEYRMELRGCRRRAGSSCARPRPSPRRSCAPSDGALDEHADRLRARSLYRAGPLASPARRYHVRGPGPAKRAFYPGHTQSLPNRRIVRAPRSAPPAPLGDRSC